MKKIFSKKRLMVIFLIAIVVLVPIIIFAYEPVYYRSAAFTNNGKAEVLSKIGSSTIINRSDNDLFVPNNTAPEYTAWSKDTPNYVEVSVCDDGVCGEGEPETCKDDCPVYESYCGDGICKQSGSLVRVNYPTPRTVTYDLRYCDFYRNKWMYVPIVNINI